MDPLVGIVPISDLEWTLAKTFLIALFLTPIVRDIFRAYNIVDRPGLRKVHAYPIPRLGGISIAAAFVIGLTGLLPDSALAWKLLPGAAVIFATGILDDFFNLPPRLKLLGQILAAVIAFWSGLRIPGPFLLSLILTMGWLLVATNAFNLVDGLDGLCAGVGLIATATLFFAARFEVGTLEGRVALEIATLPLAGALLGFLCHNFSRATMFLGDSGALLIGFLVGCYGLLWTAQTPSRVSMLAPVLACSIPLFDLFLSIARRFVQGRPIFSADRRHLHHRLLDRGLTKRRAVVVIYLWAACGSALALLLGYPGVDPRWHWVILALFCLTTYAGIRQLRYSEFKVAARLLIRGEFQRALQGKMRIQDLADALERSPSEDEWWDKLACAARDAGWSAAQWRSRDSVRRETVFEGAAPPDAPGWSFQVALGGDDAIRIDGTLQVTDSPLDLFAFAETVQRSFAARHRDWQQPELS
jgi:UDP-GlcNAc:undecaprenyl-phosphate/decaprenyl-phosphate GlcNAc-1-phosphate transferase